YALVNKVVHSTRLVVRGASTCTGNWIRIKSDGAIKDDSEGLTLLQSRRCDRVLIQTDSME
ncbi:hypothetical protein Gorai_014728, partial [Gossypium raimondii]|nr:hypothetical protein [Gossypium raimondii]